MRDPRALANSENLKSYRAWVQEGYRRSGFNLFMMGIPIFAVAPTISIALFKHAIREAGLTILLTGSIIYFAVVVGLGLLAALRLNSWRHAHVWTPPSSRSAQDS
jgi:hypothetical protein